MTFVQKKKKQNPIRQFFIWILDWVVKDKDADGSYMNFEAAGMVVTGFMRDYRLLSKIDPKHFIDAKGNVRATHNMFNSDLSMDVKEIGDEDEAEDGVESAKSWNHKFSLRFDDAKGKPKTERLVLDGPNPKAILHELETVPVPADFNELDSKLSTYMRIHDLIRLDSSRGNRETIQDVIQRLQNRKKYMTDKKLREFFEQFKNTTDAALNHLLDNNQHLKIGPADDFIPEMPVDAHEKMLSYSDTVVSMCGAKPVFYLIAKISDFRQKGHERKGRDPILLAQSPIGFYWQIIGAWDEEMTLVNDL